MHLFLILIIVLQTEILDCRRKRCSLRSKPRNKAGTSLICNTRTGKWLTDSIVAFSVGENDDTEVVCPEEEVELSGFDLDDGVVEDILSWQQCGSTCQLTKGCSYWTWIEDHYTCHIKSGDAILGYTLQVGSVSGSSLCPNQEFDQKEGSSEESFQCGKGWTQFDTDTASSCYMLLTDYKDISNCREDCRQWTDGINSGHLVSIHSEEENKLVEKMIKSRPSRRKPKGEGKQRLTWLGGLITEVGGDFFWEDGTEWNYENWDVDGGEPQRKVGARKQAHNCTYMGYDPEPPGLARWSDGICKVIRITFDCVCQIASHNEI